MKRESIKKAMVVAAVVCSVVAVLAFAIVVQAGPQIMTLYSSATGTTGQVTGPVVYAPFTVGSAGCDINTSPTATVSVLFQASNAVTTFRTEATPSFDSAGLATATTCSTATCNVQFTKTYTAKRVLVTAATNTTAVVTVNCAIR